jgi:hypothetical protein
VTKKSTAILSLMRNVFARESLPPAPERVLEARRRGGFARLLLAPEPLALEPARPERPRRGVLRLLFTIEALPPAPIGATPPPRRGRWLRWLFAPEPLDPSDP